MAAQKVYVSDLKEGEPEGVIKGRIVRLWKTGFGAIEFLFVDEMGDNVYCRFGSFYANDYPNVLEEGGYIKMVNYEVCVYADDHRLTKRQYYIEFKHDSQATPIDSLNIPRYCFDLQTVQNIEAHHVDSTILIDFVGQLLMSSLETFPDKSSMIAFLLEDSNGDAIKVYLWDDLAVKIVELFRKNEGPYEVVIAGCLIHFIEDLVTIQGIPQSSVYVNVDILEGLEDFSGTKRNDVDVISNPADNAVEQSGREICSPNETIFYNPKKRKIYAEIEDEAKKRSVNVTEIIDLTGDD